jgi:hypothetical protein
MQHNGLGRLRKEKLLELAKGNNIWHCMEN